MPSFPVLITTKYTETLPLLEEWVYLINEDKKKPLENQKLFKFDTYALRYDNTPKEALYSHSSLYAEVWCPASPLPSSSPRSAALIEGKAPFFELARDFIEIAAAIPFMDADAQKWREKVYTHPINFTLDKENPVPTFLVYMRIYMPLGKSF